ncbi:ribosome maturation factor RimP [Alphaproteobacteria bacterium]|nr:ribosome maturation factor RimP [Alphaproteobacteria bacterium]
MVLESKIKELLVPSLEAMGFSLVRIRITGGGENRTLQLMIDRLDEQPISIEDCALVSRNASVLLDVEDPINGAYMLEVSSPGIDRPLTKERDFERYVGFEAKLELRDVQDGQRRFRGRLLGCENGVVKLLTEAGETSLPFGTITAAKLILTDELVAAHERQVAGTVVN